MLQIRAKRVQAVLELVCTMLLELAEALLRGLNGALKRVAQRAEVVLQREVGVAQLLQRLVECCRLRGSRGVELRAECRDRRVSFVISDTRSRRVKHSPQRELIIG